ncbi:Protein TRIGALACTOSYLDIACYLGLYCEROL 2 [Hibiscus syriacus]|uniref:Protein TRIGALACTOSYLDIACYLGLYCEROL 2 n=1 Tax=Hibiscus syriacus TaxID=106335 RepID=A0A6A2YH69_HIBSY|nr:Protein TRIGALACTOSYLDIACYLGLYCEROL 2 [Hibiscus syriacus]
MVGNTLFKIPTCPSLSSSTLTAIPHSSRRIVPCLPPKPRSAKVRVMSASTENNPPPCSSEEKNPLAVDIPRNIWRQALRPLSDSLEGGVGLFLVSGTVLLALSLAWLRGFQIRSKFRKYLAVFEFAQASGICTGTPVRIRGVTVGNFVRVNPSLRSIEAVIEVEDDKIVIRRNSLIEEGLIVCDRQKIKGEPGVSLDELVGIVTHLASQMEEIGIANTYALAEQVASVIQNAKPLLRKIEAIAEDVQPLLAELHDRRLRI